MTKLSNRTITKVQFANEYSIISSPGKFKVKATGQNNEWFNERIADSPKGADYDKTILVNLKAVNEYNVPKIVELFKGRTEIDLAEFNKLTLVYQINLNINQEYPNLPFRNEEVVILVENAIDRETGENNIAIDKETGEELGEILNITKMTIPEAKATKSFKALLFSNEEKTVEVELEEDVAEKSKF